MGEKVVPHSRPTLGEEEVLAAAEVLRSGYIAQGKKVEEFEERLAEFAGVKGAVALNSGTSALHLGLMALGIGEGDEVLLPSFVCSAPMNSVYMAKAQPRLCDIEPESYNISLNSIEDNKTEKSKAVIVPHMFGSPADLERIEQTGVPVVEDCAQAIGAVYGNRKVGSIGRFSILSFYANKVLGCGEGGALLSDDDDILGFARDRRDYDEKENYKLRYNYKMTDLQAAVGLVQLSKLPKMIEKRKDLAAVYDKAFSALDVVLPKGEFDHIYYRYTIRIKKDLSAVISHAKQKGVNCERPVYRPLHRYLELRSGFRNTDEAFSKALSIPIYPSLTDEEQQRVIETVQECLK
ncbi:MAG: DegT/DnrJ/EryC1/StrS family aminotransferase [Candidatus Omnitrophota bacterium]